MMKVLFATTAALFALCGPSALVAASPFDTDTSLFATSEPPKRAMKCTLNSDIQSVVSTFSLLMDDMAEAMKMRALDTHCPSDDRRWLRGFERKDSSCNGICVACARASHVCWVFEHCEEVCPEHYVRRALREDEDEDEALIEHDEERSLRFDFAHLRSRGSIKDLLMVIHDVKRKMKQPTLHGYAEYVECECLE